MKNAPAVGSRSWRQGAFLVALLAVGASALPFLRSWRLPATGTSTLIAVSEEPDDKVRVRLFGENAQTFRYADLTRQEAAELGRALLEAAGQPEKPEGEPEKRGCRKSITRADSYYCGSLTGEVFWIRKDQLELEP